MGNFIPYSLNIAGEIINISRPLVMGIINVTPDSFFAASRCDNNRNVIADHVNRCISEGVDIIDIGAYSSRPGAEDVPASEESDRLALGIEVIRSISPSIIISVDTFRADVARKAIEAGANIINDISGGDLDSEMFSTVAHLHVPYILMHMRGTPADMNTLTSYNNVTADVIRELGAKVDRLRTLGVCDIIIDPGFGFSKTVEQNYELMNNVKEFHSLELPVLVGISRKSMIYRPLGFSPAEALNGTSVLNTIALLQGSHILRVHDVRQAVEAVKIVGMTTGDYDYDSLSLNI